MVRKTFAARTAQPAVVPAENKRKKCKKKKIYRRLLNDKWVLQTKKNIVKIVVLIKSNPFISRGGLDVKFVRKKCGKSNITPDILPVLLVLGMCEMGAHMKPSSGEGLDAQP